VYRNFDTVFQIPYNADSLKLQILIVFLGLAGGLLVPWNDANATLPTLCPLVNQVVAEASQTNPKDELVIIVDPFGYQAGELLPDFADQRGYVVYNVLSSDKLPDYLVHNLRNMNYPVIEATDWFRVIQNIRAVAKGRKIRAILPGTESGVPLASFLSEKFDLPGNPFANVDFWREKTAMHTRLAELYLDHAASGRTHSADDAMAWISKNIKQFPRTEVVIKPPSSAGTDRVFFCTTKAEIEHALSQIIGKTDIFGETNHYAIIQERLRGDEYIVDTVSTTIRLSDGSPQTVHHLAGAWRYHRRPSAVHGMADVIDYVSWVPVSQLPPGMVKYARNVLMGLEIKFGPAHLEIMQTNRGPVLIELGARLPGGLPLMAADVTAQRQHQIEMTLDSVLDPEKFAERFSFTRGDYVSVHEGIIVFLSVEEQGLFLDPETLGTLNSNNFPTIHGFRRLGKLNEELELTTNVTNALMRVHFVGERDAVWEDVRKLQYIHKNRAFFKK